MALPIIVLDLVGSALKKLTASNVPSKKVLSLGYPDILANRSHIEQLFGGDIAQAVKSHPDSPSIIRWHNIADITEEIVDSRHLFELLGFQLDIVDIVQARGDEIILDLNFPVPSGLRGNYALVIDSGTCEHCFNIAQSVKNVAEMCAKGGFVLHGNPLNMFNHGFYNLNPTWYFDFYETNGFSLQFLRAIKNSVRAPELIEVPASGRFMHAPENASILAIAQREAVQEIVWPVQAKYKKNPTLQG